MAGRVYCFGSINRDLTYTLPHMPAPGETLAALSFSEGLGGKGANQSVAAARAGARVIHLGAVGADGASCLAEMARSGVDVSRIHHSGAATGHAVIYVDPAGENQIVIHAGANAEQSPEAIAAALGEARPGDILLLQNETVLTAEAAQMGKDRDCFVIYSAAPFDPQAAAAMLLHIHLLVMNRIECEALQKALALPLAQIPVPGLLVTYGAEGAMWRDQGSGEELRVPAFPADPLDTTGAGDCFIGNVAAALAAGLSRGAALRRAAAASAIQVTRPGAAKAMPTAEEVDALLAQA